MNNIKGLHRDVRKIILQAEERGWSGRPTKKHYILFWPGGGSVTIAATPSTGIRALQNAEADLRRVERQHPIS